MTLRLLAVLVALSAQHRLSVLRFTDETTSGVVHGQLRATTLDGIDGVPVTASGTQTMDVCSWFAAQSVPYHSAVLGIDQNGNLLVALPYPELS